MADVKQQFGHLMRENSDRDEVRQLLPTPTTENLARALDIFADNCDMIKKFT